MQPAVGPRSLSGAARTAHVRAQGGTAGEEEDIGSPRIKTTSFAVTSSNKWLASARKQLAGVTQRPSAYVLAVVKTSTGIDSLDKHLQSLPAQMVYRAVMRLQAVIRRKMARKVVVRTPLFATTKHSGSQLVPLRAACNKLKKPRTHTA